MAPSIISCKKTQPVEIVESCLEECFITQNTPQERESVFLGDVYYDELVGVTLRRAPGYHFLISICGRFVMNDKFPHITKIYHSTALVRENYPYLNIERIKMHKLVAGAWVFNPCPSVFTVLDHIDQDRMNNHANNIRYLTTSLNNQNKQKDKHKYYRGPLHANGGVYFQSYIIIDGKEVKLKTHGSRAAATAWGKKERKEKFIREYNECIASHKNGALPIRHPHMLLWTDRPVVVPNRDTIFSSVIRRTAAHRSAHYTL